MKGVPALIALSLLAWRPATEDETARAIALGERFRCPTCRFVSVSESSAPISLEILGIITEMVVEGKSDSEIETFLVSKYGAWVVFEPPKRGVNWLPWVVPLAVVMVGGIGLARRLIGMPKKEIDG
ncbi:cytochrome c-type biogenesis protein CcmH [bacterium]|nr:cytochrome c-type biogenesis protein CcmH [bacterium]